jgi:hypothetical protein
MSAGKRKNEATIMVALWCTIPLVALMYHTYLGTGFMLWFSVIYSGIFFFSGLPIFMGHAGLLAGFNTMDPKERNKYDIEKICRFFGIGMFVIAMATFYTALILMMMGNESLLILAIILLPVAGVIALIIPLNGKRFKRNVTVWEGSVAEDQGKKRYTKWAVIGSLIVTVVIVIGVVLLIGSGKVSASMDDDTLHVNAPMMNRSINYEDIVSVELRYEFDRTGNTGFNGFNMVSGKANHSEFGSYTQALYRNVDAFIIVKPADDKVLVFNLDTVDKTVIFYNELQGKI